MTEVRWTPQAADDLQAIHDFIGRDSPHYAQVVVEDLLAAIDRLERFPLMGRHVPERRREDLRELIKQPYRSFTELAKLFAFSLSFAPLDCFHPNWNSKLGMHCERVHGAGGDSLRCGSRQGYLLSSDRTSRTTEQFAPPLTAFLTPADKVNKSC